jgi:hypothetical protein
MRVFRPVKGDPRGLYDDFPREAGVNIIPIRYFAYPHRKAHLGLTRLVVTWSWTEPASPERLLLWNGTV